MFSSGRNKPILQSSWLPKHWSGQSRTGGTVDITQDWLMNDMSDERNPAMSKELQGCRRQHRVLRPGYGQVLALMSK